MATYNKFESFAGELCFGTHKLKAADDMLKVMLVNSPAPVATNDVKADLTEISAGNGYTAGGDDAQNDCSESGGTATLTCQDITFTASGGAIGPFRYVILYNDTPTSPADPLISWWDYGSNLTLNDGDSFKVDFGASTFTLA